LRPVAHRTRCHAAGASPFAIAATDSRDGSLYPALYKLEQEGWIAADWKTSVNGRLLQPLADREPVHRLESKNLEQQHVQRALHQIGRSAHRRPLGNRPSVSENNFELRDSVMTGEGLTRI
jgi:hypothetical protein